MPLTPPPHRRLYLLAMIVRAVNLLAEPLTAIFERERLTGSGTGPPIPLT